MYELTKMEERYLRLNLLGPGPRLMKKEFTVAAVSQRLRNTDVDYAIRRVQAKQEGLKLHISVQFRLMLIFVNVSKSSDPDVGLRKLQYATRVQ